MSSKTLAHAGTPSMEATTPVRSRRATWRLVGAAVYYPIAIGAIYVLVWLLARNEFALWLRIFGGGSR